MLESYREAGKIASKIRKQAAKKITAGMKVIDLIDFIEGEIFKTGAGLSFPCNISINEIAAHYTSPLSDDTIFFNGDIVKIDLGAEVDGYISDTAVTVVVEGDNIDPVDEDGNPLKMPGRLDNGKPEVSQEDIELRHEIQEASAEALENVSCILKDGVTLNDIGKVVQDTIGGKGFTPIINLAGHSLEQNNLHAGLSIPNYPDGSTHQLHEGDHVAIEPFASNGSGITNEVPQQYIYSFINNRPLRNPQAKMLLKSISKHNRYFPFAQRHIKTSMDERQINRALRPLMMSGAVYGHDVLKDSAGGMVAQTEHTFIIEKEGCEITTL
ncbi:MAG: type II methionyl aminopeptidase [Methanosphaera sp.]|nr:type II methionyl aminopeptidase [Methanosphaera sp.]